MGMNYAEALTVSFLDELEKIGMAKTAAFSMSEKLKRLQERRDPDGIERKEGAARPK